MPSQPQDLQSLMDNCMLPTIVSGSDLILPLLTACLAANIIGKSSLPHHQSSRIIGSSFHIYHHIFIYIKRV